MRGMRNTDKNSLLEENTGGKHYGEKEGTFREKERSKILGTLALLLLWGIAITGLILGGISITKTDKHMIAAITPGDCILSSECQIIYGNSTIYNVSFNRTVVDTHKVVDLTDNSITIPKDGIYRIDSNIYIFVNSSISFLNGTVITTATVERDGVLNSFLIGKGAVYVGDGSLSDPFELYNVKNIFSSGIENFLKNDVIRLNIQFVSQFSGPEEPIITIIGDTTAGPSGVPNILTEFMVTKL